MRGLRRLRPASGVLALACAALVPLPAGAQEPGGGIIQGLEATPVGALPPLPLPMPASRNHNYWGFRFQAGQRRGRRGPDLLAVAGSVDLQWRGGSVFGLTGGYLSRDCAPGIAGCDGHLFVGARARMNFITGGPTIASVLGDHTATTTLGVEVGTGYAHDVDPGFDACTADLGTPVSLSMLQRVRVVAFFTPAVGVEIDCSETDRPTRLSFLTNLGVGVQQLGFRGLDVYVGLQKIFRGDTGYQLGITAVWVLLP